jgi:hypothetical protein
MPASAFMREYMNVFDSIEHRFFAAESIAAAFGDLLTETPDQSAEPDPVLHRAPAFARAI